MMLEWVSRGPLLPPGTFLSGLLAASRRVRCLHQTPEDLGSLDLGAGCWW